MCQAKGFVCEFCNNDKDIIFPFQLSKCQRCEGEPSRPRISFQLNWRDWKILTPRRLARALSRDRKEGEGGEELGVDQEVNSGEQQDGGNKQKADSRDSSAREGTLHHFSTGKMVYSVPWIIGSENQQEKIGTSEKCSSLESLDEGCRSNRVKSFSKREDKNEQEMESKEEEGNEECIKRSLVKTEEEEKAQKGTDSVKTEKFSVFKLLKPHQLASVFSKHKSKEEKEGESSESDAVVNTEVVKQEQECTADAAETKWRNRKTRKARRLNKGRKSRVSGGEDGASTEENKETEDGDEGVGGQE